MSEKTTNDSIKDKFAGLAEFNGTLQRMVFKAENGMVIGAAIFVLGPIETTEILNAVADVEAMWDEPPPQPRIIIES